MNECDDEASILRLSNTEVSRRRWVPRVLRTRQPRGALDYLVTGADLRALSGRAALAARRSSWLRVLAQQTGDGGREHRPARPGIQRPLTI